MQIQGFQMRTATYNKQKIYPLNSFGGRDWGRCYLYSKTIRAYKQYFFQITNTQMRNSFLHNLPPQIRLQPYLSVLLFFFTISQISLNYSETVESVSLKSQLRKIDVELFKVTSTFIPKLVLFLTGNYLFSLVQLSTKIFF